MTDTFEHSLNISALFKHFLCSTKYDGVDIQAVRTEVSLFIDVSFLAIRVNKTFEGGGNEHFLSGAKFNLVQHSRGGWGLVAVIMTQNKGPDSAVTASRHRHPDKTRVPFISIRVIQIFNVRSVFRQRYRKQTRRRKIEKHRDYFIYCYPH